MKYVTKKVRSGKPLPPGMDAAQTFKYIYHISKQIEAGTAIAAHWEFLNQYANPNTVAELRKMALKRAAGIKDPNPMDARRAISRHGGKR